MNHSVAGGWDLFEKSMQLLDGDGCKRNEPEAVALLRCAVFGSRDERNISLDILGGAPAAQFQLGMCYRHGRGARQDLRVAFVLLRAAAGGGGGNIGPTAKEPTLDMRALSEFRGHSGAKVALSEMYESGTFVRKDLMVARTLLTAAAAGSDGDGGRKTDATGGSTEANFLLGLRLESGRCGYPVDAAAAVRHYCTAAAEHHARACFNLSSMHARGEGGLRRDLAAAIELCHRAADLGDADAQHACGMMYSCGLRDNGARISLRSPKISSEGESFARSLPNMQTAPRYYYVEQKGGPTGDASLRASETASPSGTSPMEPCFGAPHSLRDDSPVTASPRATGDVLVQRNPKEAVKWWHQAVEQGHGAAQYDLGLAYAYGIGVERNDERALVLWNLAGYQGDILSHEGVQAEQLMRDSITAYPHCIRVEPYWLFSVLDRAPPSVEIKCANDNALRHNSPGTVAAAGAIKGRGRLKTTPTRARKLRRPMTRADAERALVFHIAAGDHGAVRKLLDLAIVDDMLAPIPEDVRHAVIESGGPEGLLELKRVGSLSRSTSSIGGGKGVDPDLVYETIDYMGFATNLEAFSPAHALTSEAIREEVGHFQTRKKHAEIRKAHLKEAGLKREKQMQVK